MSPLFLLTYLEEHIVLTNTASFQSNGSQNGTVEITPCGDGTYCCGSNNLRCCNTNESFTIPTQSSVVAANVTETVLVTHTASSGDASTFRGATIGLGAALGVVALAGLGAVLWLLRRNRSLYQQLVEAQSAAPQYQDGGHHAAGMAQTTPGSHAAHPYQESSYGGDTITNATSSPNPQHGFFKPPLSPSIGGGGGGGRGTPGSPSEIDGQRYSELDATMGNGNRGSLMTSPLQEGTESGIESRGQSPRIGVGSP